MNKMDTNQLIFRDTLSRFPGVIQISAKQVLDMLDSRLNPQIGVVAIPFDKARKIILHQTGSHEFQDEDFIPIRQMLAEIPDFYLDDLAPDVRGVLWQTKVEVMQSMRSILANEKSNKLRSFTIFPEFMHGYCVTLFIQVDATILDSYPSIPDNAMRLDPKETSLLHEAIIRILYDCLSPLAKIGEGLLSHPSGGGADASLRAAGFWLMRTVEKSTGELSDESLFHTCNSVSSLRYEGSESIGRFIICAEDSNHIDIAIEFESIIKLRNFKAIRKLLELCNDKLNLLCSPRGIFALGSVKNESAGEAADIFTIEFTSHYSWVLQHNSRELMKVSYGLPSLPVERLDENSFRQKFQRTFPNITSENLAKILILVGCATHQRHGTMLVISDHAAHEATRLKKQSTIVRPIGLTPEIIMSISSIDGAVLTDPNGCCYAIGVILDGIATNEGDPSRGARYNSAIRYMAYAKELGHNCLLVVISEDGYVDVIDGNQ